MLGVLDDSYALKSIRHVTVRGSTNKPSRLCWLLFHQRFLLTWVEIVGRNCAVLVFGLRTCSTVVVRSANQTFCSIVVVREPNVLIAQRPTTVTTRGVMPHPTSHPAIVYTCIPMVSNASSDIGQRSSSSGPPSGKTSNNGHDSHFGLLRQKSFPTRTNKAWYSLNIGTSSSRLRSKRSWMS